MEPSLVKGGRNPRRVGKPTDQRDVLCVRGAQVPLSGVRLGGIEHRLGYVLRGWILRDELAEGAPGGDIPASEQLVAAGLEQLQRTGSRARCRAGCVGVAWRGSLLL